MTWKARFYIGLVIAIGALTLFWVGPPRGITQLTAIFVFSAMGVLFEALSVEAPIGNVTVSVSYVPIFAAALVYGPGVGAWVGALSSINYREFIGGKPLYRNLFNMAQLGIVGACGGLVIKRLNVQIKDLSLLSVVFLGLAFLISYIVNSALPTLAVALTTGLNPRDAFTTLLGWSVPAYMSTAPFAVLIALLYVHVGYTGVLLFVLPLLAARMSFKLYRDMRKNYIETIQSLTQAIDAKDHYTMGHSERVAYYSVEIGRKLGWKSSELDQLFFVALLHDIGKIGVKEDVLNKPGRLTGDERAAINNHVIVGASIVSKVSFLRNEADFVKYHHEHYNGRGYPLGLAGEDIPLGARIVAAADSFDAMTSHRVYQPPRTASEAIAELKRCSGAQFDPEVVAAFEKIIAERTDILGYAREAAATGFSSLAGLNGR